MNIYSVLDDSENEDESPKVTTVKKPKEEPNAAKKDAAKKEPTPKAAKAIEATEEVKPKSKG